MNSANHHLDKTISDEVIFDPYKIKLDFPALEQQVNNHTIVYLDNAATTQKPHCVIDATQHYYEKDNANVHRGVHTLSQRATNDYEDARDLLRSFLNAKDRKEIIYTRGTTDGINLVAQCFVRPKLEQNDEVLITHMEHHSNIVPWQLICEVTGARLVVGEINDKGELKLEEFINKINKKTKFISIVHLSNSLGTINPVQSIIRAAHDRGVPVLLDGAQAAARLAIDVQELDCDFYATSGHKIYGPTGIGILYGKQTHLESMGPYQGGGDMIKKVDFEHTIYNDLPYKFEAGTPNIAGAVGLAHAVKYVQQHGIPAIEAHENRLVDYATQKVIEIDGVRIIGTAQEKAGVLSFVMAGIHPHDLGTILDSQGVAIRAGHHCTMPLMKRFNVAATARASFALYNTTQDVDALVTAMQKAKEIFQK